MFMETKIPYENYVILSEYLPIMYYIIFALVRYWRRNGSTMRQYISYS
jgi:hypothetical protein